MLVNFRNHSRHRKYAEEYSLSLRDILPLKPKNYDKNRAPKYQGQPTTVYFHVTVLSLDSINEESMVSNIFLYFIFWKDSTILTTLYMVRSG